MKYIHDYEKILNKFRTIVKENPNNIRIQVKSQYVDRIKRIDAHFIWSIVLYFSVENHEEDNPVLGLIGSYYSLFHCCYSIVSLDFNIPDSNLQRIKHKKLYNLIKSLVGKNILYPVILSLFNDSKNIREFVNYLSGNSGFQKFISLRNFKNFETEIYGKISSIQYNKNLIREIRNLQNEFVNLTKTIEIDEIINKYIFPFLHMVNDYEYYGEDFLDGFCINNWLTEKVKDYLYNLDKD